MLKLAYVETVSYTHLDVYKRQDCDNKNSNCTHEGTLKTRTLIALFEHKLLLHLSDMSF